MWQGLQTQGPCWALGSAYMLLPPPLHFGRMAAMGKGAG